MYSNRTTTAIIFLSVRTTGVHCSVYVPAPPDVPLRTCLRTFRLMSIQMTSSLRPLFARVSWSRLLYHFDGASRWNRECSDGSLLLASKRDINNRLPQRSLALHSSHVLVKTYPSRIKITVSSFKHIYIVYPSIFLNKHIDIVSLSLFFIFSFWGLLFLNLKVC